MSFYEDWCAFIKYFIVVEVVDKVTYCCCRTPTKNGPPTTLDTTSLLCPHGGFLYDPSLFDNGDFEKYDIIILSAFTILCCSIVLVWPEEWKSLLQWYTDEDKPVCLLVMTDQDTVQYTSSPGISFSMVCYDKILLKLGQGGLKHQIWYSDSLGCIN